MNSVRVFISSTFRDPAARGTERDNLVTVVFPELRERVEQSGLEFFDVDLRFRLRPDRATCRDYAGRDGVRQRYGCVPELNHLRDRTIQQMRPKVRS